MMSIDTELCRYDPCKFLFTTVAETRFPIYTLLQNAARNTDVNAVIRDRYRVLRHSGSLQSNRTIHLNSSFYPKRIFTISTLQ